MAGIDISSEQGLIVGAALLRDSFHAGSRSHRRNDRARHGQIHLPARGHFGSPGIAECHHCAGQRAGRYWSGSSAVRACGIRAAPGYGSVRKSPDAYRPRTDRYSVFAKSKAERLLFCRSIFSKSDNNEAVGIQAGIINAACRLVRAVAAPSGTHSFRTAEAHAPSKSRLYAARSQRSAQRLSSPISSPRSKKAETEPTAFSPATRCIYPARQAVRRFRKNR